MEIKDTIYDRVKRAALGEPEVFDCPTWSRAQSIRNQVGRIKRSEEAIQGIGSLPITTELHKREDGTAVLIVKHELYAVRLGTISPKIPSPTATPITPSGQIDYETLMQSLEPKNDNQSGEHPSFPTVASSDSNSNS